MKAPRTLGAGKTARAIPALDKWVTMFSVVVLAYLAQGAARADAFADGRAAYDRQDFATAYALFEPLANAGSAKAQSMLGTMYSFGRGVPPDADKAEFWFTKAAAQGEPNAELQMYYLAEAADTFAMFDASKRSKNITVADALVLLRHAADQGLPYAEYHMAEFYLRGRGVPENDAAAFMWLRKASNFELPSAQSVLSKAYYDGTGTPVDLVEAYFWSCIAKKMIDRKAALLGVSPHRTDLSWLSDQLQSAQVEEVARRVATWEPKVPPNFGTDPDAKARTQN